MTSRRTWETFEAMRQAAEEGDPQAQCYLGVCYQNGQNVAQDYQEAVKWFRKAGEQGLSGAQLHAGADHPFETQRTFRSHRLDKWHARESSR